MYASVPHPDDQISAEGGTHAHVTHEVFNQAPPRVGLNEFATNLPLVEAVRRYGAGWAESSLEAVGSLVGGGAFQQDAERANTHRPQLAAFDRWGQRIDEVEYHPSYHRVIGAAITHGAHTSAWAVPKPGANVARAATFMLFAQIEPGHACPVSMTHAAIPTLRLQPELAAVWEPRALRRGYEPRLDGSRKASALFGMAMTEKQGGSDVRSNATIARAVNGGGPAGEYRLTGHKWFCSAPMSDAFLVLAQAEGPSARGLSCFLLPRVLPDGSRNTFRLQRLKDKLGNHSNASAEVELDNSVAYLVGEPGRGIPTIIEMVNRTRLDSVLGTTAGMRQAVAEAAWHARHRSAFGSVLVKQPAMTAVLADLALETEAATETAMRLARAYDDDAGDQEKAFRRVATAVAKYWICKRGPHHAYEAMESLGGNGYSEDFPLARRYREQPVMSIWEGTGTVIALDVLRTLTREPAALEAFVSELLLAAGAHAVLDQHLERTRRLVVEVARSTPEVAQRRARMVVEGLALALQASLLVRNAPNVVSDAFVLSRLGPQRGFEYGSLPDGLDVAAIVDRI